MKCHMKRLTAPKTWPVLRRATTFITRPNPGAHPFALGMPLNVILKELLPLGIMTTREAKKIVDAKQILVDGRTATDYKHLVGFMDTISIPALDKHYRMILNASGKLALIPITSAETNTKIVKVVKKTTLGKNLQQITLSDGRNLRDGAKDIRVGDSLVIEVPKQTVKKHLPLKAGSAVYLTAGKHIGEKGTLLTIDGNNVRYKDSEGKEQLTLKAYVMPIGAKTPEVKLHE